MSFLIVKYSLFFFACLFFSLLINLLLIKFVRSLGIRNKEDTIIRWGSQSKPAIGGISFYIIFLLSIIAYSFFLQESFNFSNLRFIGILFASTLGFLLGMFDDAYNTKPLIKLFTQIACSVLLISTNVYIHLFDSDVLNYAITILWVVGIMNSVNMLDNMDAISSIIGGSVILTIIINILIRGTISNPDLFILMGMFAALLGFLKYNWHPSIIYMGDTGSQFLGAFLAAYGILYFWNDSGVTGVEIWSKQVIVSVMMFSIPIIDTTTVSIKRIFKGKSPFIGGKDHTTHHISYLGLKDNQVALVYIGISLVSMALVIIALNFISRWSYFYIAFFGLYILILFTVLFVIANKNKSKCT